MKEQGHRGRRYLDVVYSHNNDAPEANSVKELPEDTHSHAQVEHAHTRTHSHLQKAAV